MKKLVAIALVLMLCVSALSVSAFAADTVKVTAEVPADWTTAYCYYWGGTKVDWPGVQMTKSGNSWTANIPANSTNVIITAGASGPQTVDLTVEVGKDVKVVLGAMSGSKYTASVNGVAPEAPVSDGYYVTGSSAIFGEWAEKNAAGKMTESNGIYVKEFKNVTPGNYSIKVNDGTWANSWGGNGENGNYDFSVDAKSTVTVKFNPADNTVSVEVNGVAVGGEETDPAPVPSGDYYVTGSSDVFSNWTTCNEAGKMTLSGSIYVKDFTGVAAGDYSIKVNDGTWDNSWGGNGENGNYDFNVADANSTVRVEFNPADNTVTVKVNGAAAGGSTTTPEIPTFDAYYVAGTAALCNGKEWDAGAAENLMTKGENGIWSITYTNVPAGEYEVKVTAGNWDNSWGLNGENVKFSIEEAGDITVKFNPATGWVSVYHGDNPLTNDVSLAGIGIALLAATAGVVALVGKKKEF